MNQKPSKSLKSEASDSGSFLDSKEQEQVEPIAKRPK
jgi:hypothetical protein